MVWPMDHHPHNCPPPTQGYIVSPQRRLPESHIPDFIEVVKMLLHLSNCPYRENKNSLHWQSGIKALQRQLNRQTDTSFSSTAHKIVVDRHNWT